jgi:hypothetical protein
MKMDINILVPIILAFVVIVGGFVGCKTIQGGGSSILVQTALSTASYAVVKNNPEYKEPLLEMANILENMSAALAPAELEKRLNDQVVGLSPLAVTAITTITKSVINAYGKIWEAKVNEFSATEYGQVLTAMGRAIRTGASATEFSTASPPVEFETSKGLILIN